MNLFVLLSLLPFACFVLILLNLVFALSLRKRTFFECYCFLFPVCSSSFSFFPYNFHRLLQCCALVIRMCTICITRFLICVYSLASPRLTVTFLVSESHD